MHGFEFTQFDIFSLEIIATQSCNLVMVIAFKAEKKKLKKKNNLVTVRYGLHFGP